MPLSSGRAARKGFHWKAGGQDTQDNQDTQDVAGPRTGECEARANGVQVTGAKHGPITSQWQARSTREWLASGKCGALGSGWQVASAEH